jgi:hypothetical protein
LACYTLSNEANDWQELTMARTKRTPKTQTSIPTQGKHIQRVGTEFDCYVDGRYLGSRPSRQQAEDLIDEVQYEELKAQ